MPGSGGRGSRHEPDAGEVVEVEATVEELREALDGLRQEIRSRFPATPAVARAASSFDWEGLYSSLRRRLGTFGMSERSGEVDEFGMDEIVLARARPILDLLFDQFWRVEVHGIERLPESGPCLLVANRSGLLPWDGLMITQAIERHHRRRNRARFTVADWLITMPFAQPFLARIGGVRAARENVERLLRSGHCVVVFPEGVKGASKEFRDRYQLQRFGRGGAVRVALEMGIPLVPVGVVGAEEAHPILFKWHAPARALGLPFFPVTPTFPFLGPLGALPLPSKWSIRVGKPVSMEHFDADAAADELLVTRLTEDLRAEIQVLIDQGLRDRESVWG